MLASCNNINYLLQFVMLHCQVFSILLDCYTEYSTNKRFKKRSSNARASKVTRRETEQALREIGTISIDFLFLNR